MIEDFKIFNQSGVTIPVQMNYPLDISKNVSNETYQAYFDGSKKGISWIYKKQRILVQDKRENVTGFPTCDLRYIVAIYHGLEGKYPPPSNAVILNRDGSVNRFLKIPVLLSANILQRISLNNDANPPIRTSKYTGGLYFSGFDWKKDKSGNLINRIQIIYDRDWIEWRKLDAETGEITELLGSGRL